MEKINEMQAPELTLRERFETMLKETKVSYNEVSAIMGISSTTLSLWKKGTYSGDNSKVESVIENYMNREKEKTELKIFKATYKNITVAQKINIIARRCHLDGKIGMVIGQSGIGKTWAAKYYAKEQLDAVYLEANSSYKPKVLFKMLHNIICGYDGKGYLNDLLNSVSERLKGSGRFIIIDQANFLNTQCLHLVRTLHDQAGIGILLLGTEELLSNVRGGTEEYRQIHSRITMMVNLGRWTVEDVKTLIAGYDNITCDAKQLGKLAEFNGKRLENLLYNAYLVANANGITEIDQEILEKAITVTIN